jgi:hypothetical protein
MSLLLLWDFENTGQHVFSTRRTQYIALVKISFDSGARYYSFVGVSAAQWYKGNLLSISEVERSLDPVSGQYQASSCTLEFSDVDSEFSTLKDSESFKNRQIQISIVDPSDASTETVLATLVISQWSISGKTFRVMTRDLTFENLKSAIPTARLDTNNFPDMPADQESKLVPIVYYTISSAGKSAVGAVPGYLVTQSNPFTYIFGDTIASITNVYRYGVLVAPASYTVAYVVYGGHSYKTVQFTTDQRDTARPDEYEITADLVGYNAGFYPRNPIVQMFQFLVFLGYETILTFPINIAPTSTNIAKQEAKNYVSCIYTGDASKTALDVLNESGESFGIIFFRSRSGKLAAYQFMADELVDATVAATLTDENDVIRDSFEIESNESVVSRLQANYMYNWVKDYFEYQPSNSDPRAEKELNTSVVRQSFNQYCIRDAQTSEHARCDLRYLQREGVVFASFDLPIENYTLDLSNYVSLTHYRGLGSGGYVNKLARIISLRINLQPKSMRVRAKTIVLPRLTASDIANCEFEQDASLISASNGAAVETWNDYSGNGNNLTQATGAQQPTYDEDGCNGEPCLVFDGSDDFYAGGTVDTPNAYTEIVVFKNTATGTQHIVVESTGANVYAGLYSEGTDLRHTADSKANYANGTIAAGTWYIATAIHNNSESSNKTKLYINGTLQTTANVDRATAAAAIAMGADAAGTGGVFSGSIAERYRFSRAIYDTERRALEAALAEKYGITLA